MNTATPTRTRIEKHYVFKMFALAIVMLSFSLTQFAQTTPQLSLADLLIGLRSKKASLPERNKILAEAVKQRGVTFAPSPEIEKELATTGADSSLLDAIRVKAVPEKPAVVEPAKTVAAPAAPDFSTYQKSGDANFGKGEFTAALADYDKSIEMKADNAAAYYGRGKVHFSLKSYSVAVTAFAKAIELSPKDAMAYLNRGASYEMLGEVDKAAADYQKAVDLDAANETAKASLKKIRDEQARAAAAKLAPPPVVVPDPVKVVPQFLNLGTLTSENAVKMVMPIYSPFAQRANIEGKVMVEVDLDEQGNVVYAKATSGHQLLRSSAEDAAEKSKFKPVTFENKPIKAKGIIVYNFSLRPSK
jgi:TonB family protein